MYLRIINNENITNPFHYETRSLFSKDYQIGIKVSEKIFQKTGIRIPDSEVDFLTLYVHYANSMSNKSKTDIIHSIIYQASSVLTEKYKMTIDKDSLDYSRFVVHLRFVIERVMRSEKVANIELAEIMTDRFSAYADICDDIVGVLEEELSTTISSEEKIYLLLHLARLNIKNISQIN